MTDRNLTHIAAVIDRSGSVGWPDSDPFYLTMQSGFDKLIAEQRQQPGKCTVTLAQFDDVYELVYTGRDINDVPPLRITPRNRTALLDAIGQTINTVGENLAATPEDQRPGLVTFVIATDGLENASHEFTLDQIHAMITRQQDDYQWVFAFLGANQDAIKAGQTMGMRAASSVTYAPTRAGGQSVFGSTSSLLSATRAKVAETGDTAAAVKTFTYSDKDRKQATTE